MLPFDPKADLGPPLNIVVWLLVSISAVFLFTRLYLKNFQNRGLWWDDYVLLAAWLLQAGQAGLVSYLINLGYGKSPVPKENAPLFPTPVNLLSTFLIVANMLGKISFALTLLRMPVRWMRIVLSFIIVTLAGTLGCSAVMVWIECFLSTTKKNCVSGDVAITYNMFSCVYSAIMDLVLAFLPWKYIWDLQMSKKEKIGVVVAMSMGVFASAAAALKTMTFPNVITVPSMIKPEICVSLIIWGNAESSICIMAASIPILRALVRDGMRGAAPLGYRTYRTGSAAMAESRTAESTGNRSVIFARQLAFPLPPQASQKPQKPSLGVPSPSGSSLDRTLAGDSPEPIIKSATRSGREDGEVWSDQDSFEMTNYDGRPQTPKDFLRSNPV
ncbi:hypothetical protein QBC47DRAFT_424162 [Echria macrotheca]|uniref:Rhodopsin domain-containing protein n=1 Tax=Echria macrotheca TaxID=438768 RepID=A0AAJ0B8K0_9PEZI|nr:hypothetical protein QBC47DRAFT_424162 [Echria macrotheca]